MKTTRFAAIAAFGTALIASTTAANAFCTFDRFTGITVCEVVTGNPPVGTGKFITSKPNIGIPGRYIRDDGKVIVDVYIKGNIAGKQKFHWQE